MPHKPGHNTTPTGGGPGGGLNLPGGGDDKPSGGSPSGGGSSSSGGGGASRSSGPTPAQARAERERKQAKQRAIKSRIAAFTVSLQNFGIQRNKHLTKIVKMGAKKQWTADQFLLRLRRTGEYKARFPGIVLPDGQRLSEDEYINREMAYKTVGQAFGYVVNRAFVANLLARGVEPEELGNRLDAIERIQTNQNMMSQFAAVAKQQFGHDVTQEDLYNFSLGTANPEFYSLYEKVSVRATATSAGLMIDDDISAEKLDQLAAAIPGYQQEGDEGLLKSFSELANSIRSLLPLSQIAGFGLTKSDLVELEFGGPNASAVADRVQRIVQDVEQRRTNVAVTPIGTEQLGRKATGRPQSL